MGTRIRDRSKADLTGDDRGSKISFCKIIIGRDLAILSPVVETRSVLKKDFLDTADTQMHRGSVYSSKDLGFDLSRQGIKVQVLDGLGSEFHGRGQKGSHHTDKGLNFVGVGEVFFQVFHFSQQMSIAVLDGARSFIIPSVTVYHQDTGQGFLSQDHLGDFGRSGFSEQKEADLVRGKEPNVAILSIGSPTGFIGMLDKGLAILFHQFSDDRFEQVRQTMKALNQTSRIDPELLTDPTEGNSVQVMHDGRGRDQLIAEQMFR